MEITEFDLRFTDPDLADALAKATPPDGFKIVALSPQINASAGADIIFRIIVHLPHAISIEGSATIPATAAIALISGWIAAQLKNKVKNREDKKGRLNNEVIPLDEQNIVRIVQKQIAAQVGRERQRAEDDKQKNRNKHNGV